MSNKIKKMKHQQQKYIKLETSFNELSKKCESQEELKVFMYLGILSADFIIKSDMSD